MGGLPEIINHNTGLLVDANNPEALYQAMYYLCSNQKQAVRMGQAAFAHIRAHFSSDTMIASYEEIYFNAWSAHNEKISRQLLAE